MLQDKPVSNPVIIVQQPISHKGGLGYSKEAESLPNQPTTSHRNSENELQKTFDSRSIGSVGRVLSKSMTLPTVRSNKGSLKEIEFLSTDDERSVNSEETDLSQGSGSHPSRIFHITSDDSSDDLSVKLTNFRRFSRMSFSEVVPKDIFDFSNAVKKQDKKLDLLAVFPKIITRKVVKDVDGKYRLETKMANVLTQPNREHVSGGSEGSMWNSKLPFDSESIVDADEDDQSIASSSSQLSGKPKRGLSFIRAPTGISSLFTQKVRDSFGAVRHRRTELSPNNTPERRASNSDLFY